MANRRARILNKGRNLYIDIYKGTDGPFISSRKFTRDDGTVGRSSLNGLFLKKDDFPVASDVRFHAPLFVGELMVMGVIK